MIKLILFVLCIVGFASAVLAQGVLSVNAVDFTSNPTRFNGKSIVSSCL